MLGLKPRLRARNSLWDLVNKHHHPQSSTEPLPREAAIAHEIDDLPPLPTTPRPTKDHSPSPSPISEVTDPPVDSEPPYSTMAPVRIKKGALPFRLR